MAKRKTRKQISVILSVCMLLLLFTVPAAAQDSAEYKVNDLSVKEGDIVVAGENFGCGSSREQAPSVLKALGVKAVIAKSFARIFYRNSINIGLPVIISKDLYDKVENGDEIDIDLTEGKIITAGETLPCTKLPPYMQNILDHGGLINFLNEGEV